MERRFGRGQFFLAWAALLALQVGALTQLPQDETETSALTLGIIAVVVLLQVAKLPITAWRLYDIGRPQSDALFFVLIPVANIVGLLRFMPEATPSAKAWERRRRGWSNQIGPIAALGQALPLVAKSWMVLLPVVVLYGVILAGVGRWTLGLMDWAGENPDTRALLGNIFSVVAGILGIYTALQFAKRKSASRLSWLPSLFFVPSMLVAIAFTFFQQGTESQLQLILITLLYAAWQMIWMSIGGAGVVVAATLSAEQARKGEPIDTGSIFSQIIGRTLDVAGPHGTKVQAVTIGMQVLIPGIFYMLQLAFADTIAVLKPEAAALKTSGKLTWGMRGRLFKLFLALTLLFMGVHFATVSAVDSTQAAMAYYLDPRPMAFHAFAVGEILWGVYIWVLQVSLLLIYHDRVRYLKERKAERAAKKVAAALAGGEGDQGEAEPSPAADGEEADAGGETGEPQPA